MFVAAHSNTQAPKRTRPWTICCSPQARCALQRHLHSVRTPIALAIGIKRTQIANVQQTIHKAMPIKPLLFVGTWTTASSPMKFPPTSVILGGGDSDHEVPPVPTYWCGLLCVGARPEVSIASSTSTSAWATHCPSNKWKVQHRLTTQSVCSLECSKYPETRDLYGLILIHGLWVNGGRSPCFSLLQGCDT